MPNTNAIEKSTTQVDFLLLDSSSSMYGTVWENAVKSIDAYIGGMRLANVNTRTIVSVFGAQTPEYIHIDAPIAEWQPLTVGMFGGGTPLYDAISLMGRRLRDLDPPRAAITIVTDGDDNGSTFCDVHQAKAILDWCRAKGWQVTFIGAGFDNLRLARALGADEASAIGTSPQRLLEATEALAKKRAHYGLTGAPMHYSDAEKQQFGGYLPAPDGAK